MASCGRTVNRALIVVLLVASLALAILGVFAPFFVLDHADSNTTVVSTKSFSRASMTLWDVTYTYENRTETPDTRSQLRTEYYDCTEGQTYIQVAEGFSVVTCVLCCANLILSMFTFGFSPVVRAPLTVYALLAASCAALTIAVMVHGYLHVWCPDRSSTGEPGAVRVALKEEGWEISLTGIPYLAASAALGVISSLMAGIGG